MAMYGYLIKQLRDIGVLKKDAKLNNRFQTTLNKHPVLLQEIVEKTSFLQYSASLKTRIHCVIQNITEQPLCATCEQPLHMREEGKYRNTFPTFCGSVCFKDDDDIKSKRASTNVVKYGHINPLQSDKIKNYSGGISTSSKEKCKL